MRYFTYNDEYSEIAGGKTYVETDDGYALRQVTVNEPHYLASNIDHPNYGMCLGEGQIYDDEPLPNQILEITPAAFEVVWDALLTQHVAVWEQSQQQYPIGTLVHGRLLVFYPQGVIVKIDHQTLGVADDAACRASTSANNMYPGHRVTAVVKGYNLQQHWIELDAPQVHQERVGEGINGADTEPKIARNVT